MQIFMTIFIASVGWLIGCSLAAALLVDLGQANADANQSAGVYAMLGLAYIVVLITAIALFGGN